jgi:hypothetical protein
VFGLRIGRSFGAFGVEMVGSSAPIAGSHSWLIHSVTGSVLFSSWGEGMTKSQTEPDAAPPNKTLPATCALPGYAAELRRQPASFLAGLQGGGQILKRTDTIGSLRWPVRGEECRATLG